MIQQSCIQYQNVLINYFFREIRSSVLNLTFLSFVDWLDIFITKLKNFFYNELHVQGVDYIFLLWFIKMNILAD